MKMEKNIPRISDYINW